MHTHRPPAPHRRPGFSLLELLIVIGLIAFLIGMVYAVVGGMLDTAKRAATLATIAKVDKLYQQQLGAFYRLYDPRESETKALAGNFRVGGNYPLTNDNDASIVVAQKFALIRAFPQHSLEAYGFDRVAGTDDDLAAFREWNKPPPPMDKGNIVSEADSTELLFLALTEGAIRGAPPVDSSAFSASELADTDGDGFTEIVDAWGRPLRFYRWATRLVNPIGYMASRTTAAMPAAAVGATDTIQLPSGHGNNFPDPMVVEYYVVVGREQMRVTSRSSDTLDVVRGQRSTDPVAHSTGAVVKIAPFTELATTLLGFVNSDLLVKDPDDKFGAVAELTPGGVPAHLADIMTTPFPDPPTGPGGAISDYELLFHTLDSYNPPLVVSAGPDGILGLVEPGPTGHGTPSETFCDPLNIWAPGMATSNDRWRWGTLAQPNTYVSPTMQDFSIITNPGSSTLADNLTNHMEGLGN